MPPQPLQTRVFLQGPYKWGVSYRGPTTRGCRTEPPEKGSAPTEPPQMVRVPQNPTARGCSYRTPQPGGSPARPSSGSAPRAAGPGPKGRTIPTGVSWLGSYPAMSPLCPWSCSLIYQPLPFPLLQTGSGASPASHVREVLEALHRICKMNIMISLFYTC